MNKPKIRFKGFEGEWKERKIGDALLINSGRDYKHLEEGDIPVYGTGGYMLSVNERISDCDAIGIGRKGTIDKPQYLRAPFWTVDTLFFLTAKVGIDLDFAYNLSQVIGWRKYDESTGVPSLSKNNIEKIPISLPSLPEQRALASYFTSLDAQIAASTSRLSSLKQIKAASLLNMFPQNGETVPRVRFKGFQGEWKERKIGDALSINSGRDYKHLEEGDIPVYGTGGYMLSVNERISDCDAIGIGRKGTIDKPQYLRAPFWTVDTLFFLTAKVGIDLDFAYNLSQVIGWRKYDESTGVPSLSKNNIEKIPISLPSLSEQRAIASYFTALDAQITLQRERLEKLKQIKAACLEKMFA